VAHLESRQKDFDARWQIHLVELEQRIHLQQLIEQRDEVLLTASFCHMIQGSHASWKVLDFFSWKFQDVESPGKSL